MRNAIVALQETLDSIKALRDQKVAIYLNSTSDILHISDHAKVRYLERIEHIHLEGDTDKDKLASANGNLEGLDERMLKEWEKEKIVREGIKVYQRDDIRFVIMNLKVVTVTKL